MSIKSDINSLPDVRRNDNIKYWESGTRFSSIKKLIL